jgi:hypothetical protein
MLIDLQTQFDILPISISGSLTQSNADQMQKYFLDQAQLDKAELSWEWESKK